MPEIRTRYTGRKSVPLNTGSESYVQQQFKDDCDIHTIINRFTRGLPYRHMAVQPQFGDFSDVQDYQQAQNVVARTKEYFDLLPSDLRARFANNPAEFLRFVNDPANTKEAIELGILQKAPETPVTDVSKPIEGSDITNPQTPVQNPDSGQDKVAA